MKSLTESSTNPFIEISFLIKSVKSKCFCRKKKSLALYCFWLGAALNCGVNGYIIEYPVKIIIKRAADSVLLTCNKQPWSR